MTVRPYLESDKAAIEELLEQIWGDDEGAKANQQFGLRDDSSVFLHTQVAETNGRVVGFATFSWWSGHPQRNYLTLNVYPEFRRQGIGRQLWHSLESLPQAGERSWQTATYQHHADAVSFLHRAGFKQVMRTLIPTIAPREVDLGPLIQADHAVQKLGYRIVPLSQLSQSDARERLAEMHFQTYAQNQQRNPPSESMYERRLELFMGEDLNPESMFVALKDGECAAFSSVRGDFSGDGFDFAWMGVADGQEAHAFELMLAIKRHELEYTLAHGIERLTAEIDDPDDPMAIRVFERLASRQSRVWLTFELQ